MENQNQKQPTKGKTMMQDENKITEKKSLFSETRTSKDFNTLLTPGIITSSAQISREKPTDEEWFQVWGNTIEDLEEMAVVKIPIGVRGEDYILRGTHQFKEDAKNSFKKVRAVRVAYYVTTNGRPGLWLVSIPIENKNGHVNPYVATANQIIEKAQHSWVKKVSNIANGYYDGFHARPEDQQIFGEPTFRLGYEEAILKSFGNNFITKDTIESDPHLRQTAGISMDLKVDTKED